MQRGNNLRNPGSIPASAGQPPNPVRFVDWSWVYPRECGAAKTPTAATAALQGLSPRVRGSRYAPITPDPDLGSIPASAGQPKQPGAEVREFSVYPRECGAAAVLCIHVAKSRGLSPRVRGSLIGNASIVKDFGSIPASAGQPHSGVNALVYSQVYPRECGAANIFNVRQPYHGGLSPRVRGSQYLQCTSTVSRRSIPASAGQPR